MGERGFDWRRLFHIDARIAQQIEWELGAAALEEGQILIAFFLSAPCHSVGQGNGCRHTGGVFVDVERAIEVGNAEAFERHLNV